MYEHQTVRRRRSEKSLWNCRPGVARGVMRGLSRGWVHAVRATSITSMIHRPEDRQPPPPSWDAHPPYRSVGARCLRHQVLHQHDP